MKKLLKKVIPLMLVFALFLSSTSNALAATTIPDGYISSPIGGTWQLNNIVAPNGYVTVYTVKIVYIPAAQAQAINDALIYSTAVRDVIVEAGAVYFTTTMANKILTKTGANLTSLVGAGWLCYDLLKAIEDQRFRNTFLAARQSSPSGAVKYTSYYYVSGGYGFEFTAWNGTTMPFCVALKYTDGYCSGNIAVGDTDVPLP